MKTLKLASVALATGALFLSSIPSVAVAAPQANVSQDAVSQEVGLQELTPQTEAKFRASLSEYGVTAEHQDGLVEKLRTGKPFDVFTDASPITTEHRSTATEDEVIERYADGSFKAQSVEKAVAVSPDVITPLSASITNCQYSGGSGYAVYRNCSVSATWTTVVNIGFVATYQHVNGQASTILSVGNTSQNCAGVHCTTPTASIGQASSLGTSPAFARGTTSVSAVWGNWDAWVELQVRPSTAIVVQS